MKKITVYRCICSQNIQFSISLKQGRTESLGNDDVSSLKARMELLGNDDISSLKARIESLGNETSMKRVTMTKRVIVSYA